MPGIYIFFKVLILEDFKSSHECQNETLKLTKVIYSKYFVSFLSRVHWKGSFIKFIFSDF